MTRHSKPRRETARARLYLRVECDGSLPDKLPARRSVFMPAYVPDRAIPKSKLLTKSPERLSLRQASCRSLMRYTKAATLWQVAWQA